MTAHRRLDVKENPVFWHHPEMCKGLEMGKGMVVVCRRTRPID